VVAAFTVFFAGGALVWLAFRPTERTTGTTPVDLPDVARVVCAVGNATALTREVRPQLDGVHVMIDNRSGARAFLFQDPKTPARIHSGELASWSQNNVVTPFPPGEILVRCLASAGGTPDRGIEGHGFARIRIVDPEGLWTSDRLECSNPTRFLVTHVGRADTSPDQVVWAFAGVRPDDRVENPAYPRTRYREARRVIIRNGEPIALLSLRKQVKDWWVVVRACPGSGIAPPR
jgi:hypothetical protein